MRAPASLLAIPLLAGCAVGLVVGESAAPGFAIAASASAFLALIGAVGALTIKP